MDINQLKIVYKHKAFANSAGGFLEAFVYATENNMVLVTSDKEFRKQNQNYFKRYRRYPEFFMFIFLAKEY